jgi:pyridoxamine 5'-phosphate oxidase
VLTPSRAAPEPIGQFRRWERAARRRGEPWGDVIALATSDRRGRPSVRAVILRSVDDQGFVFYTDRRSRKGRELARTPWAAGVVLWPRAKRQVRIEGVVTRIADRDSDAYFATRPRRSQLAAWASDQSEPIASRTVLDRKMRVFARRFTGKPVPRPPHWGGYRLVPAVVEFWQGRASRLHDRVQYRRIGGGWQVRRLAP